MTDRRREGRMRKRLGWIIPLSVLLILAAAFFIYVSVYYHADDTALAALRSDDGVTVSETNFGWFFDGSGEDSALVFYPGAKVEAAAYAPLLKRLAEGGMDVFLVKMPFNLAFFGMNRAESVMRLYEYENWYVGGHSLGGAMAAEFASDHGEKLEGVILFAAYPSSTMKENLTVLSIYGSEDGVLNFKKVEKGRTYVCGDLFELEIPGGNHARFGSYGAQRGDGEAKISPEEQQEQAVSFILSVCLDRD